LQRVSFSEVSIVNFSLTHCRITGTSVGSVGFHLGLSFVQFAFHAATACAKAVVGF
jgi:hypothetical protein